MILVPEEGVSLTEIPQGVYPVFIDTEKGIPTMSSALDVTVNDFGAEVLESDRPVVVDFWAPWCGPCRMVGPEIDKLAARLGDSVKFVKVNIDENPDLAVRYGVMSIPTIAKFVGGDMSSMVVGARGADALMHELSIGV